MMNTELTPRQAYIFDIIKQYIGLNKGRPPTTREIASIDEKKASDQAILGVVNRLVDKGYLTKTPGISRGIRVNVWD